MPEQLASGGTPAAEASDLPETAAAVVVGSRQRVYNVG